MKRFIILIYCSFFILTSCQHNDVCAENEPTTPRLVIEFYNADQPSQTKPVNSFNARALNAEEFYFKDQPITDTIVALPLRTDQHSTTYEFVIGQADSLTQLKDTIKLSYTPEETYINRACGFREKFNTLKAKTESNNHWINTIKVPDSTNISNEKTTHLYIYH